MSKYTGKNLWIWVLAAVILAAVLAQGRKNESIEIMGAFFEILGDILSLLATQTRPSSREKNNPGPSGCPSRA